MCERGAIHTNDNICVCDLKHSIYSWHVVPNSIQASLTCSPTRPFFRVRKILNLRLFDDENGRAWSKSVTDREFEVLCVSQFTLQCILKGNKPDFHAAMPAELAQPFYNSFLENMRCAYKPELIKGA